MHNDGRPTDIFKQDYTFQQGFNGVRLDIYKRLARCGEVLYAVKDFDELKQHFSEVPDDDKAGIDGILTYAQVDNCNNLIPDAPMRTVKVQIKTIRAEKTQLYGYNITVATDDVDKLDNVDYCIQLFATSDNTADFVVVDAKALKAIITDNKVLLVQNFRRVNKWHSTMGFYWIPVESRKYRPMVITDGKAEDYFGLPVNSIVLCSDNIWEIIALASFRVDELTIPRAGKL